MTTQTAEHRWARFREARDTALAETHGWLSLTSFQWLDGEAAELESIPGRWSSARGAATLVAQPSDALIDLGTGQVVDGSISAVLADEESLMWVAYGGADGRRIVVELARRADRYAVRTRDAEAPTLTGFTGVPVFAYRPDLVVEGRFDPYDEPREERIRTANPDVPGSQRTAGEVVFALPGDGREFRLHAAQEDAGSLSITFHDTTNGTTTADWRKLTMRRPRPDGTVVLDFNRAINYPSAFTPYGTCPMPVSGNTVDAPIEAGERKPTA